MRWMLWNSFYKQDVEGHYNTGDCHSSMQPGSDHSGWQTEVKREKKSHPALHVNPHFQGGILKSLVMMKRPIKVLKNPPRDAFKYCS